MSGRESGGRFDEALSLYVAGLPRGVRDDELVEAFADSTRARVMPRGAAFVEFATEEQLLATMDAMNGADFKGAELRVERMGTREPRAPREPRGDGDDAGASESGARRDRSRFDESLSLYVAGLPRGVRDHELVEAFSGSTRARVMPRGVAFVEFDDEDTLGKTLEAMNGADFKGSELRVERMAAREPRAPREPAAPREPREPREPRPSRNRFDEALSLYVAGLPRGVRDGELVDAFEGASRGRVMPRGAALVEFADADAMNKALEAMDGADFKGSELRVERMGTREPREPRERAPREPREPREDQGRFDESLSLYVAGLPRGVRDGELVEIFAASTRARVMPRGAAFVEFADADAMNKALEAMNGADFKGAELRVERMGAKGDKGDDQADGDAGAAAPAKDDAKKDDAKKDDAPKDDAKKDDAKADAEKDDAKDDAKADAKKD